MGASGRKILRPYKWVNSETAAYAQGGADGGDERGDEIPKELDQFFLVFFSHGVVFSD